MKDGLQQPGDGRSPGQPQDGQGDGSASLALVESFTKNGGADSKPTASPPGCPAANTTWAIRTNSSAITPPTPRSRARRTGSKACSATANRCRNSSTRRPAPAKAGRRYRDLYEAMAPAAQDTVEQENIPLGSRSSCGVTSRTSARKTNIPMTTPDSQQQVEQFREQFGRVRDELGRMIVGQGEIIEAVLVAFFAAGHVLLEGVPGLGKTMLVRTLADAVNLKFSRVQFTPDLMPSDIIGTNIIREDEHGRKSFQFQPGPVFANILLADEINRATPKTQSALLEAMQEKHVTVAGETHRVDEPFMVLATQNPLEMEGTYPLPEAQLDRFLFKLKVTFPTADDLHTILDRTTQTGAPQIAKVIDAPEVLAMRATVRDVPMTREVQAHAIASCWPRTRTRRRLAAGEAVRALRGESARGAGAHPGGEDLCVARRPLPRLARGHRQSGAAVVAAPHHPEFRGRSRGRDERTGVRGNPRRRE